MHRPMPPGKRPKLWAGTPPAIFPALSGLLMLGLDLRQVLWNSVLPQGIADLFLGAVTLLFLFGLLAYLAKAARRPRAVVEDLRTLPGQVGLGALAAGVVLLSPTLIAYDIDAALVALWVGLATQALLILGFLVHLNRAPEVQRKVSPAWHLIFAAPLLGAIAAVPFGLLLLAKVLFGLSLASAVAIIADSALQFARETVPPPLRPVLSLHMLPLALATVAAAELDLPMVATACGVLAIGLTLVLLAEIYWICAAGFTGLSGVFALPIASLPAACLALEGIGAGSVALGLGLFVLGVAGPAVTVLGYRILRLWARGELGPRTGASVA